MVVLASPRLPVADSIYFCHNNLSGDIMVFRIPLRRTNTHAKKCDAEDKTGVSLPFPPSPNPKTLYKLIFFLGAPIYHTWVILSNHHPSETARHSFSVFFFDSGWPTTTCGMANPTNIADANPDPPTPAERVVPLHGCRTKKDQKGDKRTKWNGRWV